MSKVFKKILSHFGKSSGSIEKAQDKPADNSGKIKLLETWINSISNSLDDKITELKGKEGSLAKCFDARLSTDFDFDDLTRKDFAHLKPALSKLHDICQNRDVQVNLDGFDLLPRVATTSISSFSHEFTTGQFMISINAGNPYNHAINPFSDKNLQEALQADEKTPDVEAPTVTPPKNPQISE